ncbi:MAG: hypothetical protein ACE145_12110 [Terriglobia bacterium]
MAIDDTPKQEPLPASPEGSGHTLKFALVFVVLAALAVGEVYTLSRIGSIRESLESQQTTFQKTLSNQMDQQLTTKITALETSNAQQIEEMRKAVDTATKGSRSSKGELRKARVMLDQLKTEQAQQGERLKQEIAMKADQQQVGALTQDFSATKGDLENTKKLLDSTRSDLGMARSEFGTLIARNHDDIETLRKLGDRDYFEFTLEKKKPVHVAGVGLLLKKTNLKRHRFNMILQADDMEVEKKDRTVNEPVFFYLRGQKRFYELVVNKVESNKVTGYVSTPKGAVEVASRSEGAR